MSRREQMQKFLDMAEGKTVHSASYDPCWDARGDEHPTVTLYFTDGTALDLMTDGVQLYLQWPEKPKDST